MKRESWDSNTSNDRRSHALFLWASMGLTSYIGMCFQVFDEMNKAATNISGYSIF